MLKATNRKQGEFTYVNISANLSDIVSLIVELENWEEELGDALSQQIAWEAHSQSIRTSRRYYVTSCVGGYGNKPSATLTSPVARVAVKTAW